MISNKEINTEIIKIKQRNKKVELDKSWETSTTRKITIFILTYIIVLIVFIVIGLSNPFLNEIIPAIAFLLSTLTIEPIKKIWIKKRKQ